MTTTSTSTTGEAEMMLLLDWFAQQDITYAKDQIKVVNESKAYHVRATRDIKVDAVLAKIPKTAVLSAKNAGCADALEEAEIGGTLALAIALMFELEQGKTSPWHGYLQSLPASVPIPLFWDTIEQQHLKGTDVETQIADNMDALNDDFNELVFPFIESNANTFLSKTHIPPANQRDALRARFLHCMSLVSSRAFDVDPYLGHCMVPLADLFNHRTGGEHVHFESDANVCVYCGAPDGSCNCESDDDDEYHDDEDDEMNGHGKNGHGNKRGVKDDDARPSPPVVTATESELASWSIKQLKSTLALHQIPHADCFEKADLVRRVLATCTADAPPALVRHVVVAMDEDNVDGGGEEDVVEMRVVRSVRAGEEVFNTYGEVGNDVLLTRYGFVEPQNSNDVVLVNVKIDDESPRGRAWRRRFRPAIASFLNAAALAGAGDDGFDDADAAGIFAADGDMDDDPEADNEESEEGPQPNDFYVDATGKASPFLLLYLHIVHLEQRAYTTLLRDPLKLAKYFKQVIDGVDGWQITASPPPAAARGGAKQRARGRRTTAAPPPRKGGVVPGPVTNVVNSVIADAVKERMARYEGSTLTEDEAALASLDPSFVGPRRWALILKIEERKILERALKKYSRK